MQNINGLMAIQNNSAWIVMQKYKWLNSHTKSIIAKGQCKKYGFNSHAEITMVRSPS